MHERCKCGCVKSMFDGSMLDTTILHRTPKSSRDKLCATDGAVSASKLHRQHVIQRKVPPRWASCWNQVLSVASPMSVQRGLLLSKARFVMLVILGFIGSALGGSSFPSSGSFRTMMNKNVGDILCENQMTRKEMSANSWALVTWCGFKCHRSRALTNLGQSYSDQSFKS